MAFESGQDKDARVATHRARFRGHDGVVIVGVAQEKARAFKGQKRRGPQGGVTFDFSRQAVAVNHYYFYVQDPEWGPAFIKIGAYLPYPIKVYLLQQPVQIGAQRVSALCFAGRLLLQQALLAE